MKKTLKIILILIAIAIILGVAYIGRNYIITQKIYKLAEENRNKINTDNFSWTRVTKVVVPNLNMDTNLVKSYYKVGNERLEIDYDNDEITRIKRAKDDEYVEYELKEDDDGNTIVVKKEEFEYYDLEDDIANHFTTKNNSYNFFEYISYCIRRKEVIKETDEHYIANFGDGFVYYFSKETGFIVFFEQPSGDGVVMDTVYIHEMDSRNNIEELYQEAYNKAGIDNYTQMSD